MINKLASYLAYLIRFIFQNTPLPKKIKTKIWDNFVDPYIAWRPLEFDAKTRFGAKLHCQFPDYIQSYIFFFGLWEPEITNFVSHRLKKGSQFVDIGANIGYFSILASQLVGTQGKVYAIEASPRTTRLLANNFELNQCSNSEYFNKAVYSSETEIELFRGEQSNIGATTIFQNKAKQQGLASEGLVSAAPLDKIIPFETLQQVTLFKIDVEGAEWHVISGMRHLLHAMHPEAEILIEINRKVIESMGGSVDEVFQMMSEAGFNAFKINSSSSVEHQVAPFKGTNLTPVSAHDLDNVADILFSRQLADKSNIEWQL